MLHNIANLEEDPIREYSLFEKDGFNDKSEAINKCCFNHNDQIIACGTSKGSIIFLNKQLENVSSIKDIDFSNTQVTSIQFSHNSHYIAYSNNSSTLKIFDLKLLSFERFEIPTSKFIFILIFCLFI